MCECWKQDKALSCDECQSMKHHENQCSHMNAQIKIKNKEIEEERERCSVTWAWGPIILLGGGGWGWGEPWGPGGPCGTVQKEWSKKGVQKRSRERSEVTAGQETVWAQGTKCEERVKVRRIFPWAVSCTGETWKIGASKWLENRERWGDVCSSACQSRH